MNKEKLNELNTLLDGLIFSLEDAKSSIRGIESSIKEISEIISNKEEDTF